MTAAPVAPPEYRRLQLQASLYAPLTRRFLVEAGVGPGMRVLDVGSGTGDVSFLAAEIVGEHGSVVGVELSPARAALAQRRARDTGHANVVFRVADVGSYEIVGSFDAFVGRFVLRELRDAVDTLHRLAALAPRGIIAFQEKILTTAVRSFPPIEALERAVASIDETRRRAGVELEIGVKLPALFRAAGLPRPSLSVEAPIGCGRDWAGFDYLAETLREMLPLATLYGVVDPEEVAIDDLAARMRAEAGPDGCIVLTPCVGAYVRSGGDG